MSEWYIFSDLPGSLFLSMQWLRGCQSLLLLPRGIIINVVFRFVELFVGSVTSKSLRKNLIVTAQLNNHQSQAALEILHV